MEEASITLNEIITEYEANQEKLRKLKKKSKKSKKKKSKNLTFVGIHARRTDHIAYERERGMPSIQPSYYLKAMEYYR